MSESLTHRKPDLACENRELACRNRELAFPPDHSALFDLERWGDTSRQKHITRVMARFPAIFPVPLPGA